MNTPPPPKKKKNPRNCITIYKLSNNPINRFSSSTQFERERDLDRGNGGGENKERCNEPYDRHHCLQPYQWSSEYVFGPSRSPQRLLRLLESSPHFLRRTCCTNLTHYQLGIHSSDAGIQSGESKTKPTTTFLQFHVPCS